MIMYTCHTTDTYITELVQFYFYLFSCVIIQHASSLLRNCPGTPVFAVLRPKALQFTQSWMSKVQISHEATNEPGWFESPFATVSKIGHFVLSIDTLVDSAV